MKLFALCTVLLGVGVASVSATCTSNAEFVACINTVAKPGLTNFDSFDFAGSDIFIHVDWVTVTEQELTTAYCGNLNQLTSCVHTWGWDNCEGMTFAERFASFGVGFADSLEMVCQRGVQAFIDSRRCAIQNGFDIALSYNDMQYNIPVKSEIDYSIGFKAQMADIYSKTLQFCDQVTDKKILTLFAGFRAYPTWVWFDKASENNNILPLDQMWPWPNEAETSTSDGRDPRCIGVGYRANHPECGE